MGGYLFLLRDLAEDWGSSNCPTPISAVAFRTTGGHRAAAYIPLATSAAAPESLPRDRDCRATHDTLQPLPLLRRAGVEPDKTREPICPEQRGQLRLWIMAGHWG
jgi:hypothetical protein